MVDQRTLNPRVGGSSPSSRTSKNMVAWWNGRHSVLKIRRPQGHGGSSPSATTNHENEDDFSPKLARDCYE